MFKLLKTIHRRLLGLDINELEIVDIPINPYQVFFDWLLEVIQYGAMGTFILNVVFGWLGWKNLAIIFAIGFARWLWFDMIKNTHQAIRGKQ